MMPSEKLLTKVLMASRFCGAVAKGEKPLASVEELEKDKQAAEDEATDTAQDANRADDEPDVLLTEAGNILLDAIQLNQRIAVSN